MDRIKPALKGALTENEVKALRFVKDLFEDFDFQDEKDNFYNQIADGLDGKITGWAYLTFFIASLLNNCDFIYEEEQNGSS